MRFCCSCALFKHCRYRRIELLLKKAISLLYFGGTSEPAREAAAEHRVESRSATRQERVNQSRDEDRLTRPAQAGHAEPQRELELVDLVHRGGHEMLRLRLAEQMGAYIVLPTETFF